MPDNSIACLATTACCMMGATYKEVICHCGHIDVPFLFGEPRSCKTEAIRCTLALFAAHESHFYSSQTTASFLFGVLKAHHHTCCDWWHKWENTRHMGGAHHWHVQQHSTWNESIACWTPVYSAIGVSQLALSRWKGESIHTLHHNSICGAQRWAQCNTAVQWTGPDQG